MANQSVWYHTQLPNEIVDLIVNDCSKFEDQLESSTVSTEKVVKSTRNSTNTWIDTSHWIAGFIWHYAMRANRENFLYDIAGIDGESMQLTNYAKGEYYKWHVDSGLSNHYKPMSVENSTKWEPIDFVNSGAESIRKISFTLQLSDYTEYTGGEFQLIDDTDRLYMAPKQKGMLIFFDSRSKHRVRTVTSGVRKSLVGWIVGPRWK